MENNLNENQSNEIQNNYVEPEKNNKGVKALLIIVIVLLLALLLLLGYKIFIHDKKENSGTKEVDNKTYEKINYEIKEEQDGEITIQYLYVNGKKIDNTKTIFDIKVEQFKDLLIANVSQPGYARNVVIVLDKDGNEIKLNSPNTNYGTPPSITSGGVARIENDILYISYDRYSDGYLDWYCHLESDKINEVTKYEIMYEYLGNGKFSNGKVVNEKTVAEVYKEELKSCSNTTVETKNKETLYKEYITNEIKNLNTVLTTSTTKPSIYMHLMHNYGNAPTDGPAVSIDKNLNLKLNDTIVAKNVVNMFVVAEGNGGGPSLYYINKNGDLYGMRSFMTQLEENKPEKLPYKNIVNVTSIGWTSYNEKAGNLPGANTIVLTDIAGNMYLPNEENAKNNSKDDVKTEYKTYLKNLEINIKNDFNNNFGMYFSNYVLPSLYYGISFAKDNKLYLEDEKIADNVVNIFMAHSGQGGYKTLYFINKDGDLYSVNHEYYLDSKKEIKLEIEKLPYKNIVNVVPGATTGGYGGTHLPIFVDIEGNTFI